MLVFDVGSYQTNSDYPDTNYLEGLDVPQPKWVVPDGSELACKIKSTRYWEPVTDDKGDLIDITPIDPPVTIEGQIADIKNQLTALDLQAVRSLRAIAAGTATEEDREKLAELEAQAEELRAKIEATHE